MQTPVQVSFKGVPVSGALEAAAWKRAAELDHFFGRITGCRVVIAAPHQHGRQGQVYSVRVDLTVPGEEIVVNRGHRFDQAHEDVYLALRDAFRAARRQLEDYVRRLDGRIKARAAAPAAGSSGA